MSAIASNWIIAFATVALAVLTAFYVVYTGRLAGFAKDSAASSARAADAAEWAVLIQVLPLVVPLPGSGTSTEFAIQLHNLGTAAAVNISARFMTAGGPLGGEVHLDVLQPGADDHLTVIDGANDIFQMALREDAAFSIEVDYRDPVGNRYRTERHQQSEAGRPARAAVMAQRMRDDGVWVDLIPPPG